VEWRFGHAALGLRGSYERGQQGWRRGSVMAEATLFF
jgi:hypothetical protein